MLCRGDAFDFFKTCYFFFILGRNILRGPDVDVHILVAALPAGRKVDQSFAFDFQDSATLDSLGDFHFYRDGDGGHFYNGAEGSLDKTDVVGAVDVLFLALEEGILFFIDADDESAGTPALARGISFAGDGKFHIFLSAGRYVQLYGILDEFASFCVAGGAGGYNFFALTLTGGAGL